MELFIIKWNISFVNVINKYISITFIIIPYILATPTTLTLGLSTNPPDNELLDNDNDDGNKLLGNGYPPKPLPISKPIFILIRLLLIILRSKKFIKINDPNTFNNDLSLNKVLFDI